MTSENTGQRIIFQIYSIQHPQIDQSYYNIPGFHTLVLANME